MKTYVFRSFDVRAAKGTSCPDQLARGLEQALEQV